ncbi:MAG: urate hydroxylase PuuD [Methylophilales bacterium]|nr:urate hydroxylase PuuD [Methylophilales bacterium]
MKNPLDSIQGTIIAGVVLLIASIVFLDWSEIGMSGLLGDASSIYAGFMRFFHVIAGVTWIGLLYYFNFVQVPALKNAAADGTASGITKHVAPLALLWFRWAALATWLAGAALLGSNFTDAFLMQNGYEAIGLGSWLGTIMLFNVWGLIWPNQQKILGMKKSSDEEKSVARRVALLASRTNTMLSIPMLLLMTNGLSHRALLGL